MTLRWMRPKSIFKQFTFKENLRLIKRFLRKPKFQNKPEKTVKLGSGLLSSRAFKNFVSCTPLVLYMAAREKK